MSKIKKFASVILVLCVFAGAASLFHFLVWFRMNDNHPVNSLMVSNQFGVSDKILSDEEILREVAIGAKRPDQVPEHLICQAWEKMITKWNDRVLLSWPVPSNCPQAALYLKAVEINPRNIQDVPIDFQTDDLCIEAFRSWSTLYSEGSRLTMPWDDISRFIPKRNWGGPLVNRYFDLGGKWLDNIPAEFVTGDFALRAVRVNGCNLEHTPTHALQDPEGPGEEKIFQAAIRNDSNALQFVPWEKRLENDCFLSWLALEQSNAALPYVPATCWRKSGCLPPSSQ